MRIGDNMVKIKNISKKYILFEVESSRGGTHDVIFNRGTHEWSCTCEDYFYRKRVCKHCYQAKSYLMKLLFKLTEINVEMNNDKLDKVYSGTTLTPQEILYISMEE